MTNNQENWTLIIKPRRGLFELNLKEIWDYRDLIYFLIRRDFIAKYKQTILGPLWFIIQPLLTTIMFTIVFGRIAKIPTDGLPHMLFYMAGVVLWNYFSKCFIGTSNTFRGNVGLFSKVYFPRLVIPITVVISNLFQFALQFTFLIGFIIYYVAVGVKLHLTWFVLMMPVLIFFAAIYGLGFGIIVSSLTTKYRDLAFLLSFGVQLWMYLTPIVYPLSQVPKKYLIWIIINPITPLVEAFRKSVLGIGTVTWGQLAYSFIFAFVVLFIGILIFNKVEQNFMDTI